MTVTTLSDTFQPKPAIIKAKRFDGSFEGAQKLQAWLGDAFDVVFIRPVDASLPPVANVRTVATHATLAVMQTDWAVIGADDTLRVVPADAFDAAYQAAKP